MSTNFQEQVRSPSWVYLLLGLFLGLNSAIATGIFIVGIIREPIFQGLQAYIFYISFLGSAIICFYLLIYFTIVKIIIESNNLIIFTRKKAKKIDIDSITSVTNFTNEINYKGASKFLALFCTKAIIISYKKNDKDFRVIISTNNPNQLIKILEEAINV